MLSDHAHDCRFVDCRVQLPPARVCDIIALLRWCRQGKPAARQPGSKTHGVWQIVSSMMHNECSQVGVGGIANVFYEASKPLIVPVRARPFPSEISLTQASKRRGRNAGGGFTLGGPSQLIYTFVVCLTPCLFVASMRFHGIVRPHLLAACLREPVKTPCHKPLVMACCLDAQPTETAGPPTPGGQGRHLLEHLLESHPKDKDCVS